MFKYVNISVIYSTDILMGGDFYGKQSDRNTKKNTGNR
jgi:hypothetical protein